MTACRVPQFDSLVQTLGYLGDPNKVYLGLSYYPITASLASVVFNALPLALRPNTTVAACVISGESNVPHADHDCLSKINVYLETGDARTIFFNKPEKPGFVYPGTDKPNVYGLREHRLRSYFEFSARPGEAWLLDVSKIHCVAMDPARTRSMLSISFNMPYEEVAASLAVM
jgi:hypothetical protein